MYRGVYSTPLLIILKKQQQMFGFGKNRNKKKQEEFNDGIEDNINIPEESIVVKFAKKIAYLAQNKDPRMKDESALILSFSGDFKDNKSLKPGAALVIGKASNLVEMIDNAANRSEELAKVIISAAALIKARNKNMVAFEKMLLEENNDKDISSELKSELEAEGIDMKNVAAAFNLNKLASMSEEDREREIDELIKKLGKDNGLF